MKNIIKIALLMTLALTFLTGCQEKENITQPRPIDLVNSDNYQIVSERGSGAVGESYYPVWDDRNIEAGYIFIANDMQYLYVNYYMQNDWLMTRAYLHLANSLADIPVDGNGVPLPEQFNNNSTLYRGVSVYSIKVPLAEIGAGVGDAVHFASKVKVVRYNNEGKVDETGTLWVGGQQKPGSDWWHFGHYQVRIDLNDPVNAGRVGSIQANNRILSQ
jgi:hypothetical protein